MTWILMTLGVALATGVTHEEVACPYGEGKVRRYHKVSSNNLGGYDSDLARYSTRAQFREFAVSTCPSNYFSVLGKDLDLVVPAEKSPDIDRAIAESRSIRHRRSSLCGPGPRPPGHRERLSASILDGA